MFYCSEALTLPCQGVHYVERDSQPHKGKDFIAIEYSVDISDLYALDDSSCKDQTQNLTQNVLWCKSLTERQES